MTTNLTHSSVFERPWDEQKGEYVNTRYLLPGAHAVADIHLVRTPGTEGGAGGAMADIPQRFVVHSPTGFEWGYGGSGPADLALNILGLFVPPPEAWRLHQHYKRDIIAGLAPNGPHTIPAGSVIAWIVGRWDELMPSRCRVCDHGETDHDVETGTCLVEDCPCQMYEQQEDPGDVADRLHDERRDQEALKND